MGKNRKRLFPDGGYLRARASPEERFARHVHPDLNSGCWLWDGAPRRPDEGYGRLQVGAKSVPAHRYAYERYVAPIPAGYVVCHKCDTPACVNPAHLFVGTQSDNILDCSRKGRLVDSRGSNHGAARLNEREVATIKAELQAGGRTRLIAQRFGVGDTVIHKIKTGRNWAHVEAN